MNNLCVIQTNILFFSRCLYISTCTAHQQGKDRKQVKSLLKKTIPLTFDAINGELEVSKQYC